MPSDGFFYYHTVIRYIEADRDQDAIRAGQLTEKEAAIRELRRDLEWFSDPDAVADIKSRIALIEASAILDDARKAYGAWTVPAPQSPQDDLEGGRSHVGSSFDSFLETEGIEDKDDAMAPDRVAAWSICQPGADDPEGGDDFPRCACSAPFSEDFFEETSPAAHSQRTNDAGDDEGAR